MNRNEFLDIYWQYYLVLEADFKGMERFLMFDLGDNNFYNNSNPTDYGNSLAYSVEIIKQYLAICSEVDVVLKKICATLEVLNAEDMKKHYTPAILTNSFWSGVVLQKVEMRRVELQPFANWAFEPNYRSPDWWTPYNRVKHKRNENLKKANLKNVMNALAGLYILEMYLLKSLADENVGKDIPDIESDLFSLVNWNTRYLSVTNIDAQIVDDKSISIGVNEYANEIDGGGAW